jgi:hypothetical protein
MRRNYEVELVVHLYLYEKLIFKWEEFLASNGTDFNQSIELGY